MVEMSPGGNDSLTSYFADTAAIFEIKDDFSRRYVMLWVTKVDHLLKMLCVCMNKNIPMMLRWQFGEVTWSWWITNGPLSARRFLLLFCSVPEAWTSRRDTKSWTISVKFGNTSYRKKWYFDVSLHIHAL